MSAAELQALRAVVALAFEQTPDAALPAVLARDILVYGGTLIGPDTTDGPAEYQLELLGITGFGETAAAAARQWSHCVVRTLDPADALREEDSP